MRILTAVPCQHAILDHKFTHRHAPLHALVYMVLHQLQSDSTKPLNNLQPTKIHVIIIARKAKYCNHHRCFVELDYCIYQNFYDLHLILFSI